jgi:hypothetical protein
MSFKKLTEKQTKNWQQWLASGDQILQQPFQNVLKIQDNGMSHDNKDDQ